jgi:hypothetical protein
MTSLPETSLRETWPWQRRMLGMMLWIPILLGVAATAVVWQRAGVQSLWFMTAALYGLAMFGVYGAVGRRVAKLEAEFTPGGGERAQALTVIGKIHAPGVVVLRDDRFLISNILGERLELPFDRIHSYKVGRWLPGKWVWGKTAFNFATEVRDPLGFAVGESVGRRWAAKLKLELEFEPGPGLHER